MADFAFTPHASPPPTRSKTHPLTCHGHSRPITHLSFSTHPPHHLISACKDNHPQLRDGLTGDWLGTFIGHKGAVWAARLSPCAALAATASADFSARVWDTFTGTPLHTLQHDHIVRAVAFPPLPAPRVLATAGMEKKLRVFDLERADAPCEVGAGAHGAAIKGLAWTRDANVLVSAADDATVRWWDLRARAAAAAVEVAGAATGCEVGAGGTVSVAAGRNVYFFDAGAPGRCVKHVRTGRETACVALSAEGGRFVTGSPADTWVRVWDWESEAEVEVGRGHHGPVWTASFSPDGKAYATGSEDGTVKLWKAVEGPYGLWK